MHALFKNDPLPTWIVGEGESEAYRRAGAVRVEEGGGLCASRNKAIDLTSKIENAICVQMSDDISWLHVLHFDKWTKPETQAIANELSKKAVQVTPLTAARYIELNMRDNGARLGGVYVNVNKGFALMTPPVSKNLFVVGDFLVVDPSSSPRFDESMTLKEDYDFTAQHLDKVRTHARSSFWFFFSLSLVNSVFPDHK